MHRIYSNIVAHCEPDNSDVLEHNVHFRIWPILLINFRALFQDGERHSCESKRPLFGFSHRSDFLNRIYCRCTFMNWLSIFMCSSKCMTKMFSILAMWSKIWCTHGAVLRKHHKWGTVRLREKKIILQYLHKPKLCSDQVYLSFVSPFACVCAFSKLPMTMQWHLLHTHTVSSLEIMHNMHST